MDALHENTLIVGAGPIGLACALSARRRGVDPLVVDAGPVAGSIDRYPIGMHFFTTPELLEIGGHPLVCAGEKPTREEALKYYRGIVRAEGLRVKTYRRLVGAGPVAGAGPAAGTGPDGTGRPRVLAQLQGPASCETVACHRLVLATGYFDHPRATEIPGEELPHVSHYFDEGHRGFDQDVVIVGGGNSAVEAALDLYRCGARVTIVHRRAGIKPTVKYWIQPDVQNRIREGSIAARWESVVERIERTSVVVRGPAGVETLPADRVYLLTGFQPDFDLFRRIGVRLDPETLAPELDGETLESNVPGVHLVGSITRGRRVSDIFIENGRFDGERVFAREGS